MEKLKGHVESPREENVSESDVFTPRKAPVGVKSLIFEGSPRADKMGERIMCTRYLLAS